MIYQHFRLITLSLYIKMNIIPTQRIYLQLDVKKVLHERCANLQKFDNV